MITLAGAFAAPSQNLDASNCDSSQGQMLKRKRKKSSPSSTGGGGEGEMFNFPYTLAT
jgi:hypothetical protein